MSHLSKIFVIIILSASVRVLAQPLSTYGLGFVAPQINGKSYNTSPVPGEILYDESDSTFWGRTHGGTWISLSGSTGGITTSGTNERVERAHIVGSGSGCTYTNSGDWVQSCARNSSGDYTLTVKSGYFSAGPTCTATLENSSGEVAIVATTSTTVQVKDYASNGATGGDGTIHLICMGN